MKNWIICACCFSFILNIHASGDYTFPVQAEIEPGVIEGNYDTQTGIQKYFGIPFAKAPVGELRWKAPQSVDSWQGVRETKKFGPRAMQPPVFGDMNFRSTGISEDCLYLNVWTPAKRNTEGLPVLVYIYGGGFIGGDGSELRYDGESMAQQGIVVVTANHRLGIFGFLAHPALSAEAPYHASGNYALLDQLATLQWVKANIAAFGGDPDRITLAGESAGSFSASYQMGSPLSKDLLAGVIGESGSGVNSDPRSLTPLNEAEQIGLDFAEKAGCPTLTELRKLSAREIYEIHEESNRFRFPIVLDGYFLPETLTEIFETGEQAQVPLLVGWNSAEITGHGLMQGNPFEDAHYVAKVKELYPEDYIKVLELYPSGSDWDIEVSTAALASDLFIAYKTWKWFDLHRKTSEQPVYRYLYNKIRPPLVDNNRRAALAGGTVEKEEGYVEHKTVGAGHSWEIEYCMGNLSITDDVYAWEKEDYIVSKTMQTYFANFIKTGNPNSHDLPTWPNATADDLTPPVMIIDTESKVEDATHDARYEFWDRYFMR